MATADGDDHRRLRSPRPAAPSPRAGWRNYGPDRGVDRAVIELIGVDVVFRDRLHHVSNQVLATGITPARAGAASRELVAVLGEIAAAKAAQPARRPRSRWSGCSPGSPDLQLAAREADLPPHSGFAGNSVRTDPAVRLRRYVPRP
ncbi:hypothetical protein [Streptomyces camelliae]|uniref:Uncharacterized protein n=1 Tax=Streptomyces camelliae TaxID=3004093 RepID=A0ABY7PBT7_9ACTN|nr:hypothetical protein [Streptomyces sp. HUAS 2-6]WBO68061.1 hypothetical protein O1G22_37205 [Streptomyces sp. HUAS 2-6]